MKSVFNNYAFGGFIMSKIIQQSLAGAEQIDGDAQRKIVKARAKLMKGQIGMASILLPLELVEVDEERCQTMATDGRHIYYCATFLDSISEDELKGVLVHEGAHVIFEHMLRRSTRDPKVWNYATDFAINIWLQENGYDLPEGGLIDSKYRGQSAEEIYRTLTNDDEALQDAVNQLGGDQPQSGDGDSQSPDGGSQSSDDESGSGGGGSGGGGGGYSSLPSTVGEVWDAVNDDGSPMSEQQMSELSTEIKRTVSMAEKLENAMSRDGASSGWGEVKEVNSADVDWKDVFRDLLQSTMSNDTTWKRLNRRHQWRGINLPSSQKTPSGGELAVAIDVSGSVSQEELNIFGTELQNIAEECGIDKIRVCYCSTTVIKNEDNGEWWDVYELDHEELDLKVRGGGGTNFDPPFNLYNNPKWTTDDLSDVVAFLYFTDGWGHVSEDVEPDVPVFWMLTEKSSYTDDLPFGEKIYIDPTGLR